MEPRRAEERVSDLILFQLRTVADPEPKPQKSSNIRFEKVGYLGKPVARDKTTNILIELLQLSVKEEPALIYNVFV